MPRYPYAIATGHDASSLTYMESIFVNLTGGNAIAPLGEPIPLGSIRRITLDNHAVTNGTKIVRWSISAARWSDFEDFVLLIWGSWDTENANVTIDTRGRDEQFHRGNAVAILPLSGQDYTRRANGDVEDLVITFRDFVEAGSGFTTGFSLGFEA